jgi:AraC-like DNA-binding protein
LSIQHLRLTLPELLSLLGLAQCVNILVYMAFRAGDARRAALPFAYFLVLGLAFFLDFVGDFVGDVVDFFPVWQWAAWFTGPPLSVLLIAQVARIAQAPTPREFWPLLLIPAAAALSFLLARFDGGCVLPRDCPALQQWLVVTGLAAGLASIAALWSERLILRGLHAEKTGQERYWVALMLIFSNLGFLALMLLSLTPLMAPTPEQTALVRTFLGLTLVYLAGTSLFRIYPQTVPIVERKLRPGMTEEEKAIAIRVETLLALDKVYQEPSYNRADLARELNVNEAVLSRIINVHFRKSLPQLLNEKRVMDAQRLLTGTDQPVKDVAEQVGFNSLASFNRVFRKLTGTTASAYRKGGRPSSSPSERGSK